MKNKKNNIKYVIFILIGVFVLFIMPLNTVNAIEKTSNAGLINGIWYSKLPFFAGNKIKVSTAVFNSTAFTVAGKVQFFDYNTLIGETDFLVKVGDVSNVFIEWLVNEGNHAVSTKLINTVKIEAGKASEPIILSLISSPRSENFADIDTDDDGVGNKDDLDDDNDGALDEEEIKQGTDPLNGDTDGDGIPDKTDKEPLKKEEKIFSPTLPATSLPIPTVNTIIKKAEYKKYIPNSVSEFLKTSESKIAGLLPEKIDEILKQQVEKIEDKKQETKKEINQLKQEIKEKETTGLKKEETGKVVQDKIIKILKYIYFIFLTSGSFILKHKIIFYTLIFVCLFFVFKWIFGKRAD